jgi:hypothetical protein
MRYVAMLALLAFLIVPLAGCKTEETPTEEKAGDVLEKAGEAAEGAGEAAEDAAKAVEEKANE